MRPYYANKMKIMSFKHISQCDLTLLKCFKTFKHCVWIFVAYYVIVIKLVGPSRFNDVAFCDAQKAEDDVNVRSNYVILSNDLTLNLRFWFNGVCLRFAQWNYLLWLGKWGFYSSVIFITRKLSALGLRLYMPMFISFLYRN